SSALPAAARPYQHALTPVLRGETPLPVRAGEPRVHLHRRLRLGELPARARFRLERHRCRFFFPGRRRHTSSKRDWSSDVCSSDLAHRADLRAVESQIDALRKSFDSIDGAYEDTIRSLQATIEDLRGQQLTGMMKPTFQQFADLKAEIVAAAQRARDSPVVQHEQEYGVST